MVERLPVGVIMLSSQADVMYANNAARRALHPTRVRRGEQLPEPWPHFSLRRYAELLFRRKVAISETVEFDDGRAFVVSGIPERGARIAFLLIENVSGRERRARAEREFVANAAHELLTPLTGIVSAAHVLQAGAKNVPQDRDKFIDHIAAECDRLTRIARSVLILARAQSGEEPPRLEIIPLRDLLGEAVELLSAKVAIRCDHELTVLADADLLVQALTNLIANAVDHGSGGQVVVAAREIDGGLVELEIVDAEAAGSAAGESRGRYRSGSGRDGGGFGLGLSIATQSLEVMNGHLLLDGASVRIQLPRGGFAE